MPDDAGTDWRPWLHVPARAGGAVDAGRRAGGGDSARTGGSRRRVHRGERGGAIPRGGIPAVAGAALDGGSSVLPVARGGGLDGRAASGAQGSVCRRRVMAGAGGAAWRGGGGARGGGGP